MEQHYHNGYEVIHEDEPLSDCLESLVYAQAQSRQDIDQINKQINELLEVLLTLKSDPSFKFALLELSDK